MNCLLNGCFIKYFMEKKKFLFSKTRKWDHSNLFILFSPCSFRQLNHQNCDLNAKERIYSKVNSIHLKVGCMACACGNWSIGQLIVQLSLHTTRGDSYD